ncbi:hypothetical protein P3U62_08365 [Mammaliicoccus vitulinus]|uniref:hypothetical protein n=1 Tax=Mammaliicoccus vitulinus TaxID=71237 RepID=UPI002B25C63D|nr:hypothetical protein [Mammaliicoccus vitulinus]WQK87064.1 hypothetical protein P3U62_08365 [Mammaliicoccus vitulinus]
MRKVFTVERALELARKLYKNERNPLVKGYYLKFGVTMKEMIGNGLINELDNYDEVKNKIYDEMEK